MEVSALFLAFVHVGAAIFLFSVEVEKGWEEEAQAGDSNGGDKVKDSGDIVDQDGNGGL